MFQPRPRSLGDFVPSTRDGPIGLDFAAFLPANTARGFGMSRVAPLGATTTFYRDARLGAADEAVLRGMSEGHGALLQRVGARVQEAATAAEAWEAGDVRGA
jgi:hypothetical protein